MRSALQDELLAVPVRPFLPLWSNCSWKSSASPPGPAMDGKRRHRANRPREMISRTRHPSWAVRPPKVVSLPENDPALDGENRSCPQTTRCSSPPGRGTDWDEVGYQGQPRLHGEAIRGAVGQDLAAAVRPIHEEVPVDGDRRDAVRLAQVQVGPAEVLAFQRPLTVGG